VSQTGPAPAELLATARTVAAGGPGWGSSWSRATAFLARQALEDGVSGVWTGAAAGLRDCNMAAQLTSLPFDLGDTDLAQRTRQCWNDLSNACHVHPYELSPNAAELNSWLGVVDDLLTYLESPTT
jgi:hypothetical protein